MTNHNDFIMRFLKCQPDLRAFVLSLVRDRHAADDLIQDVALILWEKFETYDPSRSFAAWARGIACNRIKQYWEQSQRQPTFSSDAIAAVVSAFAQNEEESPSKLEALRHCIDGLPERSRQLLASRYEHSRQLNEMAADSNSTVDAVHKSLSRIRVVLQKCMERRLAADLRGIWAHV